MPDPIKNCLTCAHCEKGYYYGGFCLLAGRECEEQRQNPTEVCDKNLSGWVEAPPKEPATLRKHWNWLKNYITG